MSRQRRSFSAKFKSDLVIELLKGEKDLNTLAAENNIQPNLLRNWKKEFLNNASLCSMTSVRRTSRKTCRRTERESGVCQESRSVNHAGGLAQKKI